MIYIFAFSIIFVLIAVAVVFRRHAESSCRALVGKLFPGQIAGIEDILEERPRLNEAWKRSCGTRGLYKRWRNTTILVQIIQLEGVRGNASPDELRFALDQAARQSLSFCALLVCHVLSPWRRTQAEKKLLSSLQAYREIALHTHSILAEADVPLCARALARIL